MNPVNNAMFRANASSGSLARLIADLDVTSPAYKADPFSTYARLRAEAPVCEINLPGRHRAWLVTRYDDVADVLRDERFAKDRFRALTAEQVKKQPWMLPSFRPLLKNMLDADRPIHTRLRALVQKFSPRSASKRSAPEFNRSPTR